MENNIKNLYVKVREARKYLEKNVTGVKGKRNAQFMAEHYFNEVGFTYSKGRRETYTMYNLSFDYKNGAISLFINYNSRGAVTGISIY